MLHTTPLAWHCTYAYYIYMLFTSSDVHAVGVMGDYTQLHVVQLFTSTHWPILGVSNSYGGPGICVYFNCSDPWEHRNSLHHQSPRALSSYNHASIYLLPIPLNTTQRIPLPPVPRLLQSCTPLVSLPHWKLCAHIQHDVVQHCVPPCISRNNHHQCTNSMHVYLFMTRYNTISYNTLKSLLSSWPNVGAFVAFSCTSQLGKCGQVWSGRWPKVWTTTR